MSIEMKIHPVITEMIGGELTYIKEKMELPDGATVKTLLDHLAIRYGAKFEKKVYDPEAERYNLLLMMIVNNHPLNINAGDAKTTRLSDGDRVFLAPLYTGG